MKWVCSLFLLTIMLLPSASAMQAVNPVRFRDTDSNMQQQQRRRRRHAMPEGGAATILALTAGAVGCGIVWRRKKQALAA